MFRYSICREYQKTRVIVLPSLNVRAIVPTATGSLQGSVSVGSVVPVSVRALHTAFPPSSLILSLRLFLTLSLIRIKRERERKSITTRRAEKMSEIAIVTRRDPTTKISRARALPTLSGTFYVHAATVGLGTTLSLGARS